MFAVIKTGGKQYRVTRDQIITVEKLAGDAGATVEFDEILAIGDDGNQTIGTPHIDGAGVRGAIVEQSRADKIIVFKKKRRQGYRRKQGHRQNLTVLRITDITDADGKTVSAPKAKAKPAAKPKAKAKAAETKAPDKKPAAKPKAAASKAAAPKAKAAPKKKAAGTAAKAGAAKTKAAPKAKSTKTAAKSAPKKGDAKEKK